MPLQAPGIASTDVNPFATIEETAASLRAGRISSRELTELMLDRIATHESLHAFADVDRDRAFSQAEAADVRRSAGEDGPLLGVPLGVKDLFDVAGIQTRAGSLALTDRWPSTSATAVALLEQAGMVVVGRTHMVEFGYGGWGTNPTRGTPRNPWDGRVHRVPGGSSSGSAVAVAAGLCAAAIGTDTGGSIRTPASWCGVVGLKTSLGLVGRGGVVPLCPTHDTVGPITRTVRDAALLLKTMAGHDVRDRSTVDAPALGFASIEDGVAGLRIGFLSEADLEGTHPAVRKRHDEALADFARLGAEIVEMRLPQSITEYLSSGGDIMSVESAALIGHYVDQTDLPVDPVIRGRILRGRDISGPAYYSLLQTRLAAQAAFAAAFEGIDAFVMPGSHLLPIPLSEVDEAQPPNRFGRVVNYLDLAALVVPVGLSADGLPAGLQIAVSRFADPLALRIGRALERHRGGLFVQPPGL